MMTITKLRTYFTLNMLLVSLIPFALAQAQPTRYATYGKIAFMKQDAVWLIDTNGAHLRRLTSKSEKVNDFLFSPSRKYLAYSQVMGSAEEPGSWDSTETPPQRAICSIQVLDLSTVRTLTRSDRGWVYISKWLRGERLLYYDSDGFAVGQHFTYDPKTDSVAQIPDPEDLITASDFSRDDSLEAYEGEYGRALHLRSRTLGTDTVLYSGAGHICDIRFSNDKNNLAFIEFNDLKLEWLDQLWLYSFKSSSWELLYRSQSHTKVGIVNGIAWSPDDRYLAMFYPPSAIVVDVHHPSTITSIPGEEFSWIAPGKLILKRTNKTYLYDVATRSTKLFLTGASKVTVLQ